MRTAGTDLIHDWNGVGAGAHPAGSITLLDETLRDGLQSPNVVDPPIHDKIRLLHLMAALGIQGANLGFAASSERAFNDVVRLGREIVKAKLPIAPTSAARTLPQDVGAVIDASERIGAPLDAGLFVASSPIRQMAEGWDLATLERRSAEAVRMAVRGGLTVTFVAEDTTRSRPEVLSRLFGVAIENGARRICLADTVGQATPEGVKNLVTFARTIVVESGAHVGIDWHGHNDRGLALPNALAALDHGADRVHGTALGVGERAGNVPMELLLLNLALAGRLAHGDLKRLPEYCGVAAESLRFPISVHQPLVGRDVFRTAAGVHASAIVKAHALGDGWLADQVYSSVPAGSFGRKQEICVGHLSGASNVTHWLRAHGITSTPLLVEAILSEAKQRRGILSDEEIATVVQRYAERNVSSAISGGTPSRTGGPVVPRPPCT